MNKYVLTTEVDSLKPILGVFDDVEKAKAYVTVEGIIWSRPDTLTGTIYATYLSGTYAGYAIELVELNPERKR